MKNFLFAIAALSLLFACTSVEPSAEPSEEPSKNDSWSIQGFVQKGPFVQGSTITIQALDSLTLSPSGQSYSTITTNNLGAFSLDSQISTRYVETIANGYYYNEVEGKISQSPITLRAISDLKEEGSSNVNILTTLEAGLIRKLIREGYSIADARIEADRNILECFGIPYDSHDGFDKMDVTGSNDNDAILLAISIILQAGRSEGEFSEYYSKLAQTVSEGKSFSVDNMYREVVDVEAIKQNMKSRYESVPAFERYLDMDGNGIMDYIYIKIPDALDSFYYVDKEGGEFSLAIDSSVDIRFDADQVNWIEWIDPPSDYGRLRNIRFRVEQNSAPKNRQASFQLISEMGYGIRCTIDQHANYDAITITPETENEIIGVLNHFSQVTIKGVFNHNILKAICNGLSNSDNLVSLDMSEMETEDGIFGQNDEYFRDLRAINTLSLPRVKVIAGPVMLNSALLEELSFGEGLERISVKEADNLLCAGFLDGSWQPEELILPESVKALGDYMCRNWTWLKKLTVKENMHISGPGAFAGSGLESVCFESSYSLSIPTNSFRDVSSLVSLTLPQSLTSLTIGSRAFKNTKALTLHLPESLTVARIGEYAFQNSGVSCDLDLRNNDGWTIQEGAFDGCPNVLVTMNWNADDIPVYIAPNIRFYYNSPILNISSSMDETLSRYSQLELNLSDNTVSLVRAGTSVSKIINTSQLLSINEGAFKGNQRITSFDWPAAISVVPKECFFGCSSLTSITSIPESGLTTIGAHAFCFSGITNVSEIIRGTSTLGNGAFSFCPNITSVIIPSTLSIIPQRAFFCCPNLSSVNVDGPIKQILSSAFAYCDLTDASFCSNVKHLYLSALNGFKGELLDIPEGVEELSDSFQYPSSQEPMTVFFPNNTILHQLMQEFQDFYFDSYVEQHYNQYVQTVVIPRTITYKPLTAKVNGLELSLYGVKEVVLSDGLGEGIVSIIIKGEGFDTIRLPKDVTEIRSMINPAKSINNVYIPALIPPSVGTMNIGYPVIHIPAGSLDAYKAHEVWGTYAGVLVDDL